MLALATIVLLAIVAATAGQAVFAVGGATAAQLIREWFTPAGYILVGMIVCWRAVRVAEARRAWMIFAFGISVYGLGNVLWTVWLEHLKTPPIPSVADAMWLMLYPASYLGIVGLVRAQRRRVPAGIWLDGVIAGLALSAAGAALVLPPVLASVSGDALAIVTEMAYPVCDLLLAALIVGALALRAWRPDRMWGLLVSGFLALAGADCLYALQVAGGAASPSSLTNLAYDVGVLALALAAWQRPPALVERDPAPSASVLAIPAAFTACAFGLLVYDHFSPLDPLALTLALLTILVAFARTGLTFRDVRSLAETRRLALTDDLTAMPNRRAFLQRVRTATVAGEPHDRSSVGLLILDLDHFKELNDTLGHDAGDELLRQVGARLQGVLPVGALAARLGGDEFGVLLPDSCEERCALRVAEELLHRLAEPFSISDVGLRVTASVGIALYPMHADTDSQLMQHADVAMYEAKQSQSGYALYARERDKNSVERLTLAGEFAHALDAGEIELRYQPKAEASSRRIVGVEALVRWRHPSRGLIGPAEFVPIATQAGQGRALTRVVLGAALEQLRAWREQGWYLHMAVNTTVADLQDLRFPAEVAGLLAAHRIPADTLILEITETAVLADPVRVGAVLDQLARLGVVLSLDDFGTGFSSLTHLKTLPVGEVKIDRSFVASMGSEPVDAAIVKATIDLAHNVGIKMVAEGVEDEATWSLLIAYGCELVQGYALSEPVPAAGIVSLLAARARPAPRELGHGPNHRATAGGRPASSRSGRAPGGRASAVRPD